MDRKRTAWLVAFVMLAANPASATAENAPEGDDFFEKQIRPLLVEHCLECHGPKKQQGGLRLTSRSSLLSGGDSGPGIVPGKPEESLIIRAVEYLHEPKMPPKQKLPDADIARFKRWVVIGAPWPASAKNIEPGQDRATTTPQEWWAFLPVRDHVPPDAPAAGTRSPLDRFIAADLEARKLPHAAPANRETWLRRATFDLIGLPPTPEDLDAFLADPSDQAEERVIDRMLASPAYGQRWARHWLDVVRYADYHDADAKARDATCEPLQAWRYRDWIVDAFNCDLPYDQFIIHQIAGDLLPSPEGREFYADGLIATTFLSNGAWDRGDADKEKMVSDMVDDNIDTIGKAFLGLTIGCARCHDHKFDPISQQDYYGLAGIFYSTRILKELGTKGGNYTLQRVPLADKNYLDKRNEQSQLLQEVATKLAELDKKSPKPSDDDPERIALIAQRTRLTIELLPEPPYAEAASEGGTPGGLFPGIQDVPIHIRGSYTRLGPVVPRRMPAFFAGDQQPSIATGSGRQEFARWIASRSNPLTARVIVNRVWAWHFGTGLAKTPNNLGLLSEPPSHPQLLDWLTTRFIEEGWSLKTLHRRIMLSATYRQSSLALPEAVERDPENQWLGRFTARRLDAESIRDAMLSVSGTLDSGSGGPAQADLSIPRRSLYVQTARWDRSNFSTLFDAANPDASVDGRVTSTVAPQALFLLNSPFVLDQARLLALRLEREIPDGANAESGRIQHAYRLLFGRLPTSEEMDIAQSIVVRGNLTTPKAGWTNLAHVLLCSNEFVYID